MELIINRVLARTYRKTSRRLAEDSWTYEEKRLLSQYLDLRSHPLLSESSHKRLLQIARGVLWWLIHWKQLGDFYDLHFKLASGRKEAWRCYPACQEYGKRDVRSKERFSVRERMENQDAGTNAFGSKIPLTKNWLHKRMRGSCQRDQPGMIVCILKTSP